MRDLKRNSIPAGAGIGLRFQHHQAVLNDRPDVAWFWRRTIPHTPKSI